MSQPNPERKSQKQENIVRDTTVSGNFTFAPQQIETYIETQIVEISAEKVTQQALIKSSPYKGLKRFNFSDREYFFGRDALIAKLFNAVNESSFSLVLGASGSGKSSVIRAGLIPELRRSLESQKFYDLIFTPNQDPFESLHRCLLGEEKDYKFTESEAKIALEVKPDTIPQVVNTLKKEEEKWFLFIDQFEQLFTICTDIEKRKNFIEGIIRVAKKRDDSIRIVLAMRSDFLEEFSFYPTLGAIANHNNIHLVTEMYPDELRQAIEQPAAKHGVVFEKGLVEQIIKEVEGQRGYLPLLQYTLDLLWEKGCTTRAYDSRFHIEDRTLNKTNYVALEGVRGALQNRVNEIYEDICKKNENGELVTKQIFLKLVNIAESDSGSRAVSRRAYRSEFIGEAIENILTIFIDNNILVSDYEYAGKEKPLLKESKKSIPNATVELAHEIIISSWDKLKRWLEEEEELIILKSYIATETRRWLKAKAESKSKANKELLKGSRLEEIAKFRCENAFQKLGGLVEQENQFIDTSVVAQKRDQEAKQRSRNRIIQVLSGGLLLASLAAIIAFIGFRRATSLKLAAQALNQTDEKYDLALLLAAKAIDVANTSEARDVLIKVLQYNPLLSSYLRGHDHEILSLAFIEKEQKLASIDNRGTLVLWDISDDTSQHKYLIEDNQGNKITKASFSQNGQILVFHVCNFTTRTCEIRLLDIVNSKNNYYLDNTINETQRKATKRLKSSEVKSLTFSPDDKLLAIASGNKVFLWNINTGKELSPLVHCKDKVDNKNGSEERIWSVAFSNDGKKLASGHEDGTIKIWDISTCNEAYTVAHSGITVASLAYAHNNNILASGGKDNKVTLWKWNGKNLKQLSKPLSAHKNWVHSLAFSKDGKILASGSWDSTIILWDVTNPEIPQQIGKPLAGHGSFINDLTFNPQNNKMLVSAGEDKNILVWDLEQLKPNIFRIPTNIIDYPISWDKSLIAGDSILSKYSNFVTSITISHDGEMLAAGTGDGSVILWNISKNEQFILKDHKSVVWSVAFSSDGKMLASGGQNDGIILWNVGNRKKLRKLPGSNEFGRINSLAFSPQDNQILASGGLEAIALWDTDQYRQTQGFSQSHKKGSVTAVKFSPDGKTLASGHYGGFVLWDVKDFFPLFDGGKEFTRAVAFSSDGELLVTGNDKQEIKLWDVKTHKKVKQVGDSLNGHSNWVMSVAFDVNDERIFSLDFEGNILYWDIENLKDPSKRKISSTPVALGSQHKSWTRAMDLSSDGLTLATGSSDGTIFLLDLSLLSSSNEELKERVCSIVNRDLTKSDLKEFMVNTTLDNPVCWTLGKK